MHQKWKCEANSKAYDRFATEHSLYRVMCRHLVRLAVEGPCDVILEMGCGTGVSTQILAEVFPSSSIIAVDSSPTQLDIARLLQLPNVVFELARAEVILESVDGIDLFISNAAFWQFNTTRVLRGVVNAANAGAKLVYNCPPHFVQQFCSMLQPPSPFRRYLPESKNGLETFDESVDRSCDLDIHTDLLECRPLRLERAVPLVYSSTLREHLAWLEVPIFWETYFPGIPFTEGMRHLKRVEVVEKRILDLIYKRIEMFAFRWQVD